MFRTWKSLDNQSTRHILYVSNCLLHTVSLILHIKLNCQYKN